jgi:hypothetical protein
MTYITTPIFHIYASLCLSVVMAGLWGSGWWYSVFYNPLFIAFTAFNSLSTIMIVHHAVTLLWSHHIGQCISPNEEHRAECGRSAFALHTSNITFLRVMLLLFGIAVILSVIRIISWGHTGHSSGLAACGALEAVVIYGILKKMKANAESSGLVWEEHGPIVSVRSGIPGYGAIA